MRIVYLRNMNEKINIIISILIAIRIDAVFHTKMKFKIQTFFFCLSVLK